MYSYYVIVWFWLSHAIIHTGTPIPRLRFRTLDYFMLAMVVALKKDAPSSRAERAEGGANGAGIPSEATTSKMSAQSCIRASSFNALQQNDQTIRRRISSNLNKVCRAGRKKVPSACWRGTYHLPKLISESQTWPSWPEGQPKRQGTNEWRGDTEGRENHASPILEGQQGRRWPNCSDG